jgi:hypothetical protein
MTSGIWSDSVRVKFFPDPAETVPDGADGAAAARGCAPIGELDYRRTAFVLRVGVTCSSKFGARTMSVKSYVSISNLDCHHTGLDTGILSLLQVPVRS